MAALDRHLAILPSMGSFINQRPGSIIDKLDDLVAGEYFSCQILHKCLVLYIPEKPRAHLSLLVCAMFPEGLGVLVGAQHGLTLPIHLLYVVVLFRAEICAQLGFLFFA